MPSTLVHIGFAGLIGTALLADRFDTRAILIVMAAAAIPDLDTFIGMWLVDGGHRTVLHNVVIPTALLLLVLWDVNVRETSTILSRWGTYGYRVAWVSLLGGWIVAQVAVDAFFNGANLFWPLYDQFIDLSGAFFVSDQRGIVMTFIELDRAADGITIGADHTRGTSTDTHYHTGVDLGPDLPETTERRFPIADTGERFVLMMTGFGVVAFRILTDGTSDTD